MKTFITSTVFLLLVQLTLFSQNRICGWDTEKITSIEVEYSGPDQVKELHQISDQKDMDMILSFLKKVEFRELTSSNLNSLEDDHKMEYKISFKGQRDQVYLYPQSACIGKTSFLIQQGVVKDFADLLKKIC